MNYCQKIIKNPWLKMGMLVVILAVIVPELALAQTTPTSAASTGAGAVATAVNAMLGILAVIMRWLKDLLLPVLLMIGALLQNDLIYGGGMEAKLLDIWVQIRNLVNVFFVLVLVGMAFWGVVSGGSERGNFQLKTMLPKLIVGLIAVNFSFIGIKVVLDAVNVVTTAIFALPTMTSTSLGVEGDNGKAFCEFLYGRFDTENEKYKKNIEAASNKGGRPWCKSDKAELDMTSPDAISYFSQYNSRNAALVLALNIQKINLLDQVNVTETTVKSLNINFIYSTVLYVIYGSAFVAMAAVLLVRLVVLWLMIVLSPLIALKSVLPEKLQSSLSGGENIGDQFLKHVIVPIPLALSLTVGFILLDTFSKARFSDATLSFSTLNINVLVAGIPTLQQFIGALASVAFVWKGVFDAAKDTYAGEFTNSIKGAVEGAGKFLLKLPAMAPIFPTGSGQASLGQLKMALQKVGQIPDDHNISTFGNAFPGLGKVGLENQFVNNAKAQPSIKNAFGDLSKIAVASPTALQKDTVQKALAEVIEHHGQERFNSLGMNRDQLLKALNAGQLKPDDMVKLIEANGGKVVHTPGGTKAPVAGAAKPGAPGVAPSAEVQAAAKDIAAKHQVEENQLKALKYLDIFKKDTAAVPATVEPDLKKLQTLMADPKKNEKEIETILSKPEVKSALQAMAGKMDAIDTKLVLDPINANKDNPGNFGEIEKAMNEAFKKLSGGRDYDSKKANPEDDGIIQIMNGKIGGLFSPAQRENMKKGTGYSNDTLASRLFGAVPTPVKPKPGGGPAPAKK